MPTKGQGIVYPDCVGEAAPTVGWGHGKGGREKKCGTRGVRRCVAVATKATTKTTIYKYIVAKMVNVKEEV